MNAITCDDIRLEIRRTKRRLQTDANSGQLHDEFVLAAIELYEELYRVVRNNIELGRSDIDCDWMHYSDLVWTKYDVEDMLQILQAIMELPRWD